MGLIPFLSSKTVLLMAEDVLCIYKTSGGRSKLIEEVPWDADNFERNVANIISKDCGGASVVILNDMVEQHYRKERILQVGIFDQKNVVNRKLNIAFPSYPVRGAIPLKERASDVKSSLQKNVFILAAVPHSEQYLRLVSAVRQSLAPVEGFALLPVEATRMVKALADKVVKEPKKAKKLRRTSWVVFMAQHKNGGLRQVVIRNGELALTRMTPMSDSENEDLWVSEVNNELKATMSYLSRFGFNATEDKLDVIVLADQALHEKVEGVLSSLQQVNFHVLSVLNAAKHLGLAAPKVDMQRFADTLHTSWVSKRPLLLPMISADVDKVALPRKAASLSIGALFLGVVVASYLAYNTSATLSKLEQELVMASQQKKQVQIQYEQERERIEALGIDIDLVNATVDIGKKFKETELNPTLLIQSLSTALGRNLKVDKLRISSKPITPQDAVIRRPTPLQALDGAQPVKTVPIYEMFIDMSFPRSVDVDEGNKQVDQLRQNLMRMLPEHDVNILQYLRDYDYDSAVVIDSEEKILNRQDYTVRISVLGPKIEEQVVGRR